MTKIKDGIFKFFADRMNDFNELKSRDVQDISRYFPVPDLANSGKLLHILPHVSSLAHIYARINKNSKGKLEDITLYHDEQLQFEDALNEIINVTHSSATENLPDQPIASFQFKERGSLTFNCSSTSSGVQTADLIAGTVAYCLGCLEKNIFLHRDWKEVISNLLSFSSNSSLNLVSSTFCRQRLDEISKDIKSHFALYS